MDFRALFKKVESHVVAIEDRESNTLTLGLIIESILEDFEEDFGFSGARLYVSDEGQYSLESKFGSGNNAPLGFSIPKSYPPIVLLRRKGIVYMDLESQGVDPDLEKRLGVERFAAITVGAGDSHVIAFSIRPDRPAPEDDTLFALSSIRHAINLKLAKDKLESIILQSQQIQMSLLPGEDIEFPGYDVAAFSRPAEVVGGDVYDFIRINPKVLGVAIGDATGHGLPAALQARDVIIGLRVGISEDHKMIKLFEKLNQVIHGSRLTSRFVSLFYGELEASGHFIYCNAGHITPYYFRTKKDRFYPMSEGGIVLGPTSDPTYQRGFYRMEPGDCLFLYTDGITEAQTVEGEEFGETRALDYVRRNLDQMSARELIEGLLGEVARFSEGGPYTDDRTIVVVKRLRSEDA